MGCLHLIPISPNTWRVGWGGAPKSPEAGQALPTGAESGSHCVARAPRGAPTIDTSTVASSGGLAQMGKPTQVTRVFLCLDSASCPLRAASLSRDSSTVTSLLSTHSRGLHPQPHCIPHVLSHLSQHEKCSLQAETEASCPLQPRCSRHGYSIFGGNEGRKENLS